MSARDSDNYCWCIDPGNILGQGATSRVYKGFNKTTCNLVAIKTFNSKSFQRPLVVQEREFLLTLRLKHPNIVRVLAVEQETGTNSKVLVTELCEGGSLFDIISKPENAFGLQEQEFLIVLEDVAAGLKYLRSEDIIHRDLKPGNILRHIQKNGKSQYKLTDFGTARELQDDDQFTSICGTEEFLHPDMFEAVLHRKPGMQFGAHVDLWAFGVTIYQAACGKLPFRPFGGRQNKEAMFEMISKKERGTISGVQHEAGGSITWCKSLPDTCFLSSQLKKAVTELLAGCLESKPHNALSFDEVFRRVDDITCRQAIHVFYTTSCQLHVIYLYKSDVLSHLQEAIESEFTLCIKNQILLFNNQHLSGRTEPLVNMYPQITADNPLILLSCEETPQEKQLTPVLPRNDIKGNHKDHVEVRHVLACTIFYSREIEKCSRISRLLKQAEDVKRFIIMEDFKKLESIFPHISEICQLCLERTKVARDLFNDITSVIDCKKLYFRDHIVTISKNINDYYTQSCKLVQTRKNLEKYMKQYRERLVEGSLLHSKADYSVCAHNSCVATASTCVKNSERVWKQGYGPGHSYSSSTSQSWTRHMTRMRLQAENTEVRNLLMKHCLENARCVHKHFITWWSNCGKYQLKVKRLDLEINKLKQEGMSLHSKIAQEEQVFAKSVGREAHGVDGAEKMDSVKDGLTAAFSQIKPVRKASGSSIKDLQQSISSLGSQVSEVLHVAEDNTKLLQRLNEETIFLEYPGRYTTS